MAKKPQDDVDWKLATWDGAKREALKRWAALPLERIVASLEEMQGLDGELRSPDVEGRVGEQQSDYDIETKTLAHVKETTNGQYIEHWLEEHLSCVGGLAADFASKFESEDWAYLAGIWHDLGKYSADFQKRIKQVSGYDLAAHIETTPGKVNHSSAGAIYAVEKLKTHGRILAYMIAGHHAGLPDWSKLEASTGGVLGERMQDHKLLGDALEANIPNHMLNPDLATSPLIGGKEGFALWVRMLFSCLVDADFLDTEAFMDEGKAAQRSDFPRLEELLKYFNRYMVSLADDSTSVNCLRAAVLEQCRSKAHGPPGLYSLTVPTGGGKTLSSMAFSLEHAIKYGKDRIIYVIPYTSIIEQTANIFRSIFGESIIEHHSNLDPDKEDPKSKLAAENWDAPIIVTTNVQFFESLFAARTSRCRKLHNIVNSVIVLDEAQLLPTEFLEPILAVMNFLTEYYGVTFVLSTATQPALNSRSGFGWKFKGLDGVSEIIDDPDGLYTKLERVAVELPDDLHTPQSWEEIADELAAYDSVLVIVNTKPAARELHALMPKSTFHLSTFLCGQHRSDLIAEIKARLKNGEAVRVVSTQLVEAGVDMDFPVVYRALAGLDSIAQAAGRCNREGRLEGKGKVVVFVPPKPAPPGHLRHGEQTAIGLLSGFNGNPLSREMFAKYFERFYESAHSLDKHGIQHLLTPQGSDDDQLQVQFRSAANKFRLIEESGQAVIVKYTTEENDEIRSLIGELKNNGPHRWLMRKLQRYSVNVYEYHFKQLLENHEIEEIQPGIYVQLSDTLYHPILGLITGEALPSVDSLMVTEP
ncbi:CRISPR-associated helicase Cas3 [hydrothermal vent metagenome]|uniref:CRISPR-associated helicase Cas3 n=1 Tax=hydrothermal vent metagenome TaxID=652676 RepID=A0A3B0Z018_9ZZZZ